MNFYKFLVTNDIHWRSANPKARLDNYNEALRSKIAEIFEIASREKTNAILVAGDLTDTPGLGLTTLVDLALILKKSPCPIITIAGQHDEWGHNPETLRRTPYGMLRQLGYILDVSNEPLWWSNEKTSIRVSGRHYDANADRADDYYEMPPLKPDEVLSTVTIHLAHGLILDQRPGFDLRYTLLSQVETSANILCVGDYHPGIGVQRVGESLVINPGALGRLTAIPSELERQVQVCLITVNDNAEITTKLIPLKSAKPGHEVLSRQHLEAQADREAQISEFLGLLAEEGESRFLEVREIVEDLAERENLPRPVVDEALKRISKAREAVA